MDASKLFVEDGAGDDPEVNDISTPLRSGKIVMES